MLVSEIIDLMGHLSIGRDNVSADEEKIFLKYINLAHFELYQRTAGLNADLLTKQTIASVDDTLTLTTAPFLISSVIDTKNRIILKKVSIFEGVESQLYAYESIPGQYYCQKNILHLVPSPKVPLSFDVWFVPQPAPLASSTFEADIPYPVAFQSSLADGGLYYLFQEEGGFKNSQKASEAQSRWLAAKSSLNAYLYNTGGNNLSTYTRF